MSGFPSSRSATRAAAVLVRVTAFLVAGVSAIVIPTALAAAAAGHIATNHAVATAGALAASSLAAIVLARGVDPLRH